MSRFNILYIHSHDTGRYVEPYGYAIPTPNIQMLAEQGMLFRQAHCAAPTCSPSRACLLSGQSAHNAGMFGLAHRGFAMRDYSQHLCHTLKRAGYTTALAGIQHLARSPYADPADMGYDRMLNHDAAGKDHHACTADVAVQYLNNAPRQPFFLDVGFFETHRHGSPVGAFIEKHPVGDPRYVRPPAILPDTPATRQDMADFIASAGLLDRRIGQVLEALDNNGLADNTLVICTTDHGIAFPGMKCSLTDHGTGVMLIVRGPGGFAGGKVCDALISQIDVFPTLCELLQIDPPDWLQGKSMMPLVRGEAEQINDAIFAEVNYHAAYEPKRSVRTRRWKYIRHYLKRPRRPLPNTDDGASKSVLIGSGWRDQPVESEQLFDLVFDPLERHNLAADAKHAATLQEMRQRLDQWMQATDDPILRGDIPMPEGGIVTDPDDYSPGGGGGPEGALQALNARTRPATVPAGK